MSTKKCITRYFKSHPMILLLSVGIVILVTILALLPPQLLRIIVDDVIPNQDQSKLLILAIFYMLVFLSIGIINFLKEVLLVIISQGIGKAIRLEMMKKINHMRYEGFTRYDAGILESYFSNDVDEINTLITSGVISMVIDSFKMIGILISIFVFSPVFGGITLLILPFILLFTLWIRKRMYKAQMENRALEGNVNYLLLENLDNMRTIQSYRVYDAVSKKYKNILQSHFSTNQKSNSYDAIFSPIMQVLKTILIVLIICISSAQSGMLGLSIGVLVGMIDLLTNLFSPIENLGMELQTIQKSFAAIHRIDQFFTIEEDKEKLSIENMDLSSITLEFKDVCFSYTGDENVIENFNLTIKSTQHFAFQGESGSGKSTLFRLACGLIEPTAGSVTINGIEAYLLPNNIKRKLFGIVYQDYFFFGGSIYDEVTLLDQNISDSRVYEVLGKVGLQRISDIHIPFIPTDYSTGELSLFNIARAILMDARVLFLDEMNAKIDGLTAKRIIEIMNDISKDKTVCSINHYGELLDNSIIFNVGK